MNHIHSCPICASSLLRPDQKVVTSRPHFNHDTQIEFAVAAIVKYALCLGCGAYIQTPRMSDEDIHRYYADGLYREWLGIEQDALDTDELRRAKLDATIIKDICGIVDSHLDVGASRGYLLDEVGSKIKVAVEPNREYVIAPNLAAAYTDIYHMSHMYNSFELVTSIHSLEHTTDPLSMLRELSCFVRASGRLVIEVPSETSPGGWGRLAHNFHFPPWTMSYMADKVGMKITHVMFTPHLFTIMERKS
jgi:SAM-dependent methyltransferase